MLEISKSLFFRNTSQYASRTAIYVPGTTYRWMRLFQAKKSKFVADIGASEAAQNGENKRSAELSTTSIGSNDNARSVIVSNATT